MPSVRLQVNLDASPRAVWVKLTTIAGIEAWWADTARIDATEGGLVVIGRKGDDGTIVEERGLIHGFRSTRKLEIAWDRNSSGPWKGTRVLLQLAQDKTGTRLALVHSGGGMLDDETTHDALLAAWASSFDKLARTL